MSLEIYFDKGTLVLNHWPSEFSIKNFPFVMLDKRTKNLRCPAFCYRDLILKIRALQIPYVDKARDFQPCLFTLSEKIEPRGYQTEALRSWSEAGSRGIVTLPTGAGKTILAVMAIAHLGRPTLVHVPTLDLMHQWYAVLSHYFKIPIGLLGGGYHQIETITVSTYDSALLHVASKGNKFGLLVFDECHHLPSQQMQYAAISSLAPFRLGLTATLERSDGKEQLLFSLCGPVCYQISIVELKGKTLAPYTVKTIEVEMSETHRLEYEEARKTYVGFLKSKNIIMKEQGGWQQFIWTAHRSQEGKEA
ncbi:MAG: DEAD/DEAH box helicase family protein, partial [Silvanigrellaceae bacterium]|nr:DEAD/DEAH box helicase family protein [Silvanigrellaceae bacterium]